MDTGGNVYVVGISDGTWGSPIRAYSGDYDAFVAKLDGSGSLLWNLFLPHVGWGIAADTGGNVYVTGYAFVAKLDGGGLLLRNTTLGGGPDVTPVFPEGHGIAVDGSGNVYVTGSSNATWGSPIRAFSGSIDGFVAKLGRDGPLIWSTFLGCGAQDSAASAAVDGNGNAYVAGTCQCTWGSPIRDYSGGDDVFAAKLDGSGSLLWNSFLGGDYADDFPSIALDTEGNAYVAGTSNASWGSPLTPSTGTNDAFLAKLAGPQGPGSDAFITSISSRSAKPGSQATIYGGGFSKTPRMNFVYFNGYRARVGAAKTTSLKVTIPKRLKKGTVDVYVVVDGIMSNTIQFQPK